MQGLSLDCAVLDLGEAGMSYVALSRVRTLNGIALVKFEPKKLYANNSEVLPVDLSQSQEDEPPRK